MNENGFVLLVSIMFIALVALIVIYLKTLKEKNSYEDAYNSTLQKYFDVLDDYYKKK